MKRKGVLFGMLIIITQEVLWSHTWAENEDAETFTSSLENVKKDEEYVISFSGSEIIQTAVEIMFDGNLVQERAKVYSFGIGKCIL